MPARSDRFGEMKSRLQQALLDAIGERSIYQAAQDWGLPHWVLVDTLRGKVDCPSPKYLRQVARGLGLPVEEVIEAAYSPPFNAEPVPV